VSAQSESSTTDEIIGLGYEYEKGYERRIDGVTLDAVRAAAEKYFRLDSAAVVVVKGQAAAINGQK
jgi:predicted Zn-dependent peptidase